MTMDTKSCKNSSFTPGYHTAILGTLYGSGGNGCTKLITTETSILLLHVWPRYYYAWEAA